MKYPSNSRWVPGCCLDILEHQIKDSSLQLMFLQQHVLILFWLSHCVKGLEKKFQIRDEGEEEDHQDQKHLKRCDNRTVNKLFFSNKIKKVDLKKQQVLM